MPTVCLNLDLADARHLRDAVRGLLGDEATTADLRVVDERLRSLIDTLDALSAVVERSPSRQRLVRRDPREQSPAIVSLS